MDIRFEVQIVDNTSEGGIELKVSLYGDQEERLGGSERG